MPLNLPYGLELVTRTEIGYRPPRSVHLIDTPTPELWLHHSADTRNGRSSTKWLRDIQAFHMDRRGWSDIAYSFLVDSAADDRIYIGRGAGVAGGHTQGHNTVSHAICALGNYQEFNPNSHLLDKIRRLGAAGRDLGWWPGRFSGGHRDVGTTACPGSHLYGELPNLVFPFKAPPPVPPPAVPKDDHMSFFQSPAGAIFVQFGSAVALVANLADLAELQKAAGNPSYVAKLSAGTVANIQAAAG